MSNSENQKSTSDGHIDESMDNSSMCSDQGYVNDLNPNGPKQGQPNSTGFTTTSDRLLRSSMKAIEGSNMDSIEHSTLKTINKKATKRVALTAKSPSPPKSTKNEIRNGKTNVSLANAPVTNKHHFRQQLTEPIALQNRFSLLNNQNEEPISPLAPEANKSEKAMKIKKKPPPPPITVTSKAAPLQIKAMASQISANFHIRQLATCTKVFMSTEEDREKMMQCLNKSEVQYYTHAARTEGRINVVLDGLPPGLAEDIVHELTEKYGTQPLEVRQFPDRENRFAQRTRYGVDFNKTKTDLRTLQATVKVLYYHQVKWSAAARRTKGHTQCKKCAMIGHGGNNCHRAPVCIVCAANHTMADCPMLLQGENTECVKMSPCCINCVSNGLNGDHCNHRADDDACPSKSAYAEAIQRQRENKSKKTNNKASPRGQNDLDPANNVAWPNLRINQHNSFHSQQKASAETISPHFASQANPNNIRTPVFDRQSYSDALNRPTEPAFQQQQFNTPNAEAVDDTPLPFGQLMAALAAVFSRLSHCRTRSDQLQVVSDFMLQCIP